MKLAAPVNASCEVEELFRAGADDLVSGSALFASPDMRRAAMDMMA